MEKLLWKFIADRYINKKFFEYGLISRNRNQINKFIDEEDKRELKNEMLVSLLIKFICRYLPNASEEILSKDLFVTIQEINPNLSIGVKNDLLKLKEELGIRVIYAMELTNYLEQRIIIKNNQQNESNGDSDDEDEDEDEVRDL